MVSTYLKDRKLLETAKHRRLWYHSVIQSILFCSSSGMLGISCSCPTNYPNIKPQPFRLWTFWFICFPTRGVFCAFMTSFILSVAWFCTFVSPPLPCFFGSTSHGFFFPQLKNGTELIKKAARQTVLTRCLVPWGPRVPLPQAIATTIPFFLLTSL